MHVGMFADPSRGGEVRDAMIALRSLSIHAKGITIAANWEGATTESLAEALDGSTHVVIFPPEGDLPSWVIYLLGYGAGRCLPTAVVGTAMPTAFDHANVVAPQELENYLLAERGSWERRHRTELARTRLRGKEHDPDAFYQAAIAGDLQGIEDFLAVGMGVDAHSSSGAPLLVGAVRGRSVAVVQRLLNQGADPNASCGTDGTSALCEASSMGLATAVGVLLAHDADPNQTTGNGQTALMLAASQGHRDVVERLLSAGADPTRLDSLGMSAMGYARLFGREEIVAILESFPRS